jgi:hypothetical protein
VTEARGDHTRRMLVYHTLEHAVAAAAADEAAVVAARAEWNQLAGMVHDDEHLYEERAAAFLEWFTIDHASAGGVPPIEQQLAACEARLATGVEAAAAERAALRALAASHRSIFRVREVQRDGLLLDDLWGGAAFHVRERRHAGVEPGDLFDARLVADVESPPAVLLTRTFCFHPREVEQAVRTHVLRSRRAGEPRPTLLFRLLRLRVRCLRYKHVSPARVYLKDETLSPEK